jgi:hypothetical protein
MQQQHANHLSFHCPLLPKRATKVKPRSTVLNIFCPALGLLRRTDRLYYGVMKSVSLKKKGNCGSKDCRTQWCALCVHCEDVNEQLQRRQTDGQKCIWHLGTTEPNPYFSHPRVPRPNILPDILVRRRWLKLTKRKV